MKKCVSMLLAVVLLFTCMFVGPGISASAKTEEARTIAIVFDNSGSMYEDNAGKPIEAWCRATYAMEVFASMLNQGDTLLIYPMHPIKVGNKEYTMEKPFQVSDATQASQIREIYTPKAEGTPIESVDAAIAGLKSKSGKKYLVVLTDGDIFYKNDNALGVESTRKELDTRFQSADVKDMTVMYLGIGADVVMPATPTSDRFVKKQAKNSADTLSMLTEMCNQIFGRDTLPKSRISGNQIEFDISMSKLIVFVQGENVSNLKVTGPSSPVGKQAGSASTKYATAGCGNYPFKVDKTLQGMMVTYTDCAAGTYTVSYSGKATNIEVYYEPDADLNFVFTDAKGNDVDPEALYEGDYKVSFGMKDRRTGKLISSDLLGNPHYEGSYTLNGQETKFTHDGYSGERQVSLKMGDTFDANLTVTYLSGYTITKDSTDFGWPKGGIKVAARPAGDLTLEISGGQESYSIQNLEAGQPFVAKVYYQGKQLTGEELRQVELKWDDNTSNATIESEFVEDHFKLSLHYRDPAKPADTPTGWSEVTVKAFYAAPGSSKAQAQDKLGYTIDADSAPLQLDMLAPDDYIVIKELADSRPITVYLTLGFNKLTAEQFAGVELQVDCNGIEYELTPREQDSAYEIKLLETEGLSEGDYPIRVKAQYTDRIGRVSEAEDSLEVTLSNTALWLKWLIGFLLLLLLILIIWLIMHIKVLPKRAHPSEENTRVKLGTKPDQSADYSGEVSGSQFEIAYSHAGQPALSVTLDGIQPGDDSYLYKGPKGQSIKVDSKNITASPDIQEVRFDSDSFKRNRKTNELERTIKSDDPIILTHGMGVSFSGTVMDAGTPKKFTVTTELDFEKN